MVNLPVWVPSHGVGIKSGANIALAYFGGRTNCRSWICGKVEGWYCTEYLSTPRILLLVSDLKGLWVAVYSKAAWMSCHPSDALGLRLLRLGRPMLSVPVLSRWFVMTCLLTSDVRHST